MEEGELGRQVRMTIIETQENNTSSEENIDVKRSKKRTDHMHKNIYTNQY